MDVIEYEVIDNTTREKSSFLIEESLSEQIDNMIIYFTLLGKHISWTNGIWSNGEGEDVFSLILVLKNSINDDAFIFGNLIGFTLKDKSEIVTKDYKVKLTLIEKNKGNAHVFTFEEAIEKFMELY